MSCLHPRHHVDVYCEAPEDFDAVTVRSVPGEVTIRFGRVVVHGLHRDADELVEGLLNRLRFELAAQVVERGES